LTEIAVFVTSKASISISRIALTEGAHNAFGFEKVLHVVRHARFGHTG